MLPISYERVIGPQCCVFHRSHMINFFGIKLNEQELFIGSCLQFPLIFIVGWWVVPVMAICGLFWALGGAANSSKFFRRLGVPLTVCGATFLVLHQLTIFLAVPFMVWVAPSYGSDSWLFNFVMIRVHDQKKADFITRGICYLWYLLAFSIALLLS